LNMLLLVLEILVYACECAFILAMPSVSQGASSD